MLTTYQIEEHLGYHPKPVAPKPERKPRMNYRMNDKLLVKEQILAVLKGKELSIEEIAAAVLKSYDYTKSVIREMYTADLIVCTKSVKNKRYYSLM